MAPTLPPPVLDHVLSQDVLSDGDLAACCLVAKDWLDPARRTLYHQVIAMVFRRPSTHKIHILRHSVLRTNSVIEHEHLAKLVRWITIAMVKSGVFDDPPTTAPFVLGRLLRHCRNVRWLDLSSVDEDCSAVLLAAHLPLTHLFLHSNTPFAHLTPLFPSLKHLGLRLADEFLPLPSGLSIPLPSLHIEGPEHPIHFPRLLQNLLNTFCPTGNTILRRLSVPIEVLSYPSFDLSTFPSLSSLGLQVEDHDDPAIAIPAITAALSTLPQLEGLAFSGTGWTQYEYRPLREKTLPSSLPLSLRRLVLGTGFVLSEALVFLAQGKKQGLRELEWVPPEEVPGEDTLHEMTALAAMCSALGIIYHPTCTYHPLMYIA